MSFKLTKNIIVSLMSGGVSIGTQEQSVDVVMTISSLSVNKDGVGTAYLDTYINSTASGDSRSLAFEYKPDCGDIFSQAQTQIMGMDEFIGAESI
jgi:hypothetical protein